MAHNSSQTTQVKSRLTVRLDDSDTPLNDSHNLLAGFSFGKCPFANPAIIDLVLDPIGKEFLIENWWYDGDVDVQKLGDIKIAMCSEYTMSTIQRPETVDLDFSEFTYAAFKELLVTIRSTKNNRLVKIWAFFDDINEGEGDQERYRQFSVGRAKAFAELEIDRKLMPTGTAVGTIRSGPFTIVALSSADHFQTTENPRQISAYEYPSQYGPCSPLFSRAGVVDAASHQLLLVSGTAAIVGHESISPYKLENQLGEVFRNLDSLCDTISQQQSCESAIRLDHDSVLRVYLRDPSQVSSVKKALQQALGRDMCNIAFLHASICRHELMVEIDGVKML
jgi:chorismate lyase/3-hydroxybenzoate synthase